MNDNGEKPRSAHFLVTEKWFDFYSLLPGFTLVDVRERRVRSGQRLQFTIQSTDGHSFLYVTVFRFRA